jgi:hypothetical protein
MKRLYKDVEIKPHELHIFNQQHRILQEVYSREEFA